MAPSRGWGVGSSRRGCFRGDRQTRRGCHVCPLPVLTAGAATYRAERQVAGITGGPLGSGYHKNWPRFLPKVSMEREKGSGQYVMPKPSLRSSLFVQCSRSHRKAFVPKAFSFPEAGKLAWRGIKGRPFLGKCGRGRVARMALPRAGLGCWHLLVRGAALRACLQARPIPGAGAGGPEMVGMRWAGGDPQRPGQGEGVRMGSGPVGPTLDTQGCK